MNIQKSVMPFNKVLVTIDHDSYGVSFELPLKQANIEEVCQRIIAKDVATEAHRLVDEGQINLLEAAYSGLGVCKQIESEAKIFVYMPFVKLISIFQSNHFEKHRLNYFAFFYNFVLFF